MVIPTLERWPTVAATLEALSRQRLGGIWMEVVVVDNGSADGSWEALAEGALPVRRQLDLVALREVVRGAAAARNLGVLAARAPLLLFLGDDCRPVGPDFVAGHVALHRDGDGFAASGPITWDPALEITEVMRWLASTGKMNDFRSTAEGDAGPESFYTGNVSVAREAVVAVGGFDQRFQEYGWEDPELGLRLLRSGVALRHCASLAVHHSHVYDLRASLGRMEAVGRSAHLMARIAPDKGELEVPAPRGVKGFAGRLLAPAAPRLGLRAGHFAKLARGYGSAPLPDDPGLRGALARDRLDPSRRPPVSVVLPFAGSRAAAQTAAQQLRSLHVRENDELILVDNTRGQVAGGLEGVRVVPAARRQSSYTARNVGASAAANSWLLFVDADCVLRPQLIDEYFTQDIPRGCGAVAGPVHADVTQRAVAARYQRSRGHLSQWGHLHYGFRPFAITANLLARKAAWQGCGGFTEGIQSGGDAEFSFRLQDAGWTLGWNARAAVIHRHRESLLAMLRQQASYAAGRRWLNGRYPGSFPRPPLVRRLARSFPAAVRWLLTAHPERAAFAFVDVAVIAAESVGWWAGNGE